MKYVFDQMGTNHGKGEIVAVMDAAITKSEREGETTGVPPLTGYSFESKTSILPLQAADILAWTILQQMHKRLSHRKITWIAQLAWQELASFRGTLDASFFTESQLQGMGGQISRRTNRIVRAKGHAQTKQENS